MIQKSIIVPRKSYMDKVKRFMGEEEIKVITGVRRCGKTFFFTHD